MSNGPLVGTRVLDLATDRAEFAGRVLADLGAEVIKVEPPAGSISRTLPPYDRNNGESLYWAAVGMGKKSVVVDITTAAGQETLKRLAAVSDILVESFDVGVMESLGLGQKTLRDLNPRLIYVSVTPYGQDGPDAKSPATDLTLEAAGGLLSLQGDGDRPPIPVGYPQASFHGGVQAASDAIIALNERAVSGRGQYIDLSLQTGIVWTLMNATGYPPNAHSNPPGTCEVRAAGPVDLLPGIRFPNVYECKDGYVLASLAVGARGALALGNIMRWIEQEGQLPEVLKGVTWPTWQVDVTEGRLATESVQLAAKTVADFFLTRNKKELMAHAVSDDILMAPFFNDAEVVNDHQLAARDYWIEIAGRKHPGLWALLSRTPVSMTSPAPALSEHQSLVEELTKQPAVIPPVDHSIPRRGAFEGIKVADFAWVGVGPLIGKALADHGATVVHVESVTRPDVLRMGGPFRDNIPGIDRSQFMANFNSSKIGLALNLATSEGNALARKLIDWADIVIESYTPGTMKKLGLSYETLSEGRPDLIMLSTCLRGQTGPERSYAGFGTHGAVLGGFGVITGWPDRPPRGPWGAYTDFIAPRYGVAAMTSAILERRKSGLGQYIDLSQIEAAIHFVEPMLLDYTVNGKLHGGQGHHSDRSVPHGVYQCSGVERYVAIAVETTEQWQALKAVAPLDQFRSAEFDSLRARRNVENAIDQALMEWCAEKDAFELARMLKDSGVPASTVYYPSDLYSDPQLVHRGFFKTLQHSEMGPTPYDGLMSTFSDAPYGPHAAAPCLGEHTDHVLREILQVDDLEIAEAAAAGALN